MSEAINNMPAWMGEGEQGDLKIRIYKGFLVFLGVGGKSLAIVNLFKLFILVLFQLFDPVFFQ